MFSFETSPSLNNIKTSFHKRVWSAAIREKLLGFPLALTSHSSERLQNRCFQTLNSDPNVMKRQCDKACGAFCSCINSCCMKETTKLSIALHCSQFSLFAFQTFNLQHIAFSPTFQNNKRSPPHIFCISRLSSFFSLLSTPTPSTKV